MSIQKQKFELVKVNYLNGFKDLPYKYTIKEIATGKTQTFLEEDIIKGIKAGNPIKYLKLQPDGKLKVTKKKKRPKSSYIKNPEIRKELLELDRKAYNAKQKKQYSKVSDYESKKDSLITKDDKYKEEDEKLAQKGLYKFF